MEKLKNIPSLRFPEFNEEWENKKLGDIGDIKMCRRIFNDETLSEGDIPFFKIGSFGKVADAFITKELFLEYREKFSYPKKGNILISAAGTIGRLVIYNGEDAYYQDSNIVWIDNDETLATDKYLYYILQLAKFKTEGGTIQRLYNSILKSTKFGCSTLKEQTKIASFLTAVDDKLQALKQKKTLLEQYKKGVMQKIFSQELRFNDDNGHEYPDWKEKKIWEICDVIIGGTPSTTNGEYWNGNIGWIGSGELKNGLITKPTKYITELGLQKSSTYLMPKGTTVLAMTGATIGKIGYLDFDSAGNQSVAGFLNLKNIYSLFLFYQMQVNTNQILTLAGGAAQTGINKSNIESLKIQIPNLEEQTKIANFLSALDDRINHCQVQIGKTEVWKKGLLQQMFC